jgi:hypothetical protein
MVPLVCCTASLGRVAPGLQWPIVGLRMPVFPRHKQQLEFFNSCPADNWDAIDVDLWLPRRETLRYLKSAVRTLSQLTIAS